MAEDNAAPGIAELIQKLCSHVENKLREDAEGLSSEDRETILSELTDIRQLSGELYSFTKDYPQLAKLASVGVSLIAEHETKLELLKDALVSNGLIIQVEAGTKEEAVAMAKKSLEEEMLADMLSKVDKSTVH